jgi:steroid delta-isomerase-like uncharacterized protein
MRHLVVFAVLLSGFVSAFVARPYSLVTAQGATPAACPATSEAENTALALRWHYGAINGHDLSVINEIVADDIVHHAGTFPDGIGPDAVKKVLGALLTGFPDVKHTVEDVMVDGDKVVTRWTAEGHQTGEFQGYAPTGKDITWTGINIFRIECGKIAEEWSELDGIGRISQIEAAATPTP